MIQLSAFGSDESLNDVAIISRLRAGNVPTFHHVVHTYSEALLRYAARYMSSIEDAREAVQDVFLNLWSERESLAISRDLGAYLFWKTRNRVRDLSNAEMAARRRDARWVMDVTEGQRDRAPSAIETIHVMDIRRRVLEALDDVPPRTREIFLLVWDDQLSYAEVARMFGISVLTVRNQMSRAVRHLAETVGQRGRDG